MRIKRSLGNPKPWTEDLILQKFRFCNVFREDDTTTKWFYENVRGPLSNSYDVLLATIIFRWFNRIETGKELLNGRQGETLFDNWSSDDARAILKDRKPVVTGAYIIKTPNGMNKLDGVLWCIDQIAPVCQQLAHEIYEGKSLKTACELLQKFPYMGPFMAYEVVTDLRHTGLLMGAKDIDYWANPGPGAARGLGRVLHNNVDHFSRSSVRDANDLQKGMRWLLNESRDGTNWPIHWRRWEMREVEHTLCEFDKHERARRGEGTPKQRYNGS